MKRIIKHTFLLLFITTSSIYFCCCSNTTIQNKSNADQSCISVLCTTGMISDLVSNIGKSHVQVKTLINENLDPHTYELVKGDDEKILGSNLVFYNGLGLEHSPSIYRQLTLHKNSFALGDYIHKQDDKSIIYIDNELDPHIWMDISLWSKAVDLIEEKLIEIDPMHEEDFHLNATQLRERLSLSDQNVSAILNEIPNSKRYLVTCHDAFNYFARRYLSTEEEKIDGSWKNRLVAPEGLSPDSQLSTQDIAMVVDFLKAHNVKTIFPESGVNLDSIYKIKDVTRKMGHPVVIADEALLGDCMGTKEQGANTYISMLEYNANMIKKYIYGE